MTPVRGCSGRPGLMRQHKARGRSPTGAGPRILPITAVASPSASGRSVRRLTAGSGPVWPEFVAHHLQIGLRNYAVGGGAYARFGTILTAQQPQTVRGASRIEADIRRRPRPGAHVRDRCILSRSMSRGYGDLSIPAPSMLDQVGRYVDDEHRSKCVCSPGAPDGAVIRISQSSR